MCQHASCLKRSSCNLAAELQHCCSDAGVWLGEAATALARNVDYEIPFRRAQAGKLDQQLVDAERRCAEYLHLADSAAAEYRQARHRLEVRLRSRASVSVQDCVRGAAAVHDAGRDHCKCHQTLHGLTRRILVG